LHSTLVILLFLFFWSKFILYLGLQTLPNMGVFKIGPFNYRKKNPGTAEGGVCLRQRNISEFPIRKRVTAIVKAPQANARRKAR